MPQCGTQAAALEFMLSGITWSCHHHLPDCRCKNCCQSLLEYCLWRQDVGCSLGGQGVVRAVAVPQHSHQPISCLCTSTSLQCHVNFRTRLASHALPPRRTHRLIASSIVQSAKCNLVVLFYCNFSLAGLVIHGLQA